jgi:glycosyltransferase involved in cell wall biosynthesis
MLLSKISIPVLCYHKVSYSGGITPEKFEEHMQFMKKSGYHYITAKQLINFMEEGEKLPPKPVLLTFDDCFLCNWVYAIPILEKYGYRGVFFPVTDFVGKGEARPQMDSNSLPEIKDATTAFVSAIEGDNSQFFNEEELKKTYERGHEIYSHTCSHRMTFRNLKKRGTYPEKWHWGMRQIYGDLKDGDVFYTKASAFAFDGIQPVGDSFRKRSREERYQFCLKEFKESREYLEKLLNTDDLDLLCWPWGDFDDLSVQALKEAGYKGSFTLERSANNYAGDPFYINRIGVGDRTDIKWLKNKLEIYSRKSSANLFFKKFRKKNEVSKIMYATDSNKFSSGGVRQLMYNLRGMSEMGFDVTLVCRERSEIAEMAKQYAEVRFADFSKPFKAGRQLSELIKEIQPHILHTYHNKGHKAGVIAKMLSMSSVKLFANRGVLAKPGNLLYYLNPFLNGLTVNSKECAKVLASRFIPKKKLHLIHNGIDDNMFTPSSGKKVNIIYIGNDAPIKGFDLFKEAVSKISADADYDITAIGLDDAYEKDGIKSIGKVRDVQNYLHKGDIFVMSSRSESFPNVLLEAMASGMACVAFDVGAVGEIMKDGRNGFVIKPKDTDAMSKKISYLLNNPDIRGQIGENNREDIVKKFSYRAKCVNLLKLYSGERFKSI